MTPSLRLSVPLDALPFPAALLDSEGILVETNPEWDRLYPDFRAGRSSAAWSRVFYKQSPQLLAGFLEGLDKVVSGTLPRFTQANCAGLPARRVVVSEAGRAALLILEQSSGPGPQIPHDAPAHSPRLETIGRTVSGVAHDFANLLTLIAGYGDILLKRTAENDPIREEINEIRRAAERGARLTSQLLGFTREASARPQPLDLNALVVDVQRMLRPILGEHLEVIVNLEPRLGRVMADPGQLEQVVMNLLLNARDAMPAGGAIRMETSGPVLGEEEAASLGIAAGPCVLLSVADAGQGIDPGAIEQIFQPFYTTKEKGEGTGLGLSIVLHIVKECGGAVCVRSSPGEGARFLVYLPAAWEPAESGDSLARLSLAGGGSETLLVVEDDETVRRLMVRILEQRGYQVLEAGDGEQALKVLTAREAEIGLVLTDMVMPRMGGRELAARIRAGRPGFPVICMSGHTDEALSRTGDIEPGILFLRKPLRPETLAAKVREALDSCSRPFNPL
jgi:two-component system cell cycle sensor histidine kinase/response regulator CckA